MNKPDLIEAELELFCATALPELQRKCTVNHDVQFGQPFGTTCADVGCSGYIPDCTTDKLIAVIMKLVGTSHLTLRLWRDDAKVEAYLDWNEPGHRAARHIAETDADPHMALLKAVAALVHKEDEHHD